MLDSLLGRQGRVAVIEALLPGVTDVSARDAQGATPLHRAATQGHTPAVHALLAAGEGSLTSSRLLCTHRRRCHPCRAGAAVNVADREGNTPLHLACEGGGRS